MPNFDTGPATLPDVGTLSYNGCIFSPLVETSVSGVVVKDAAIRTTKLMEYTIKVDAIVTLPDNASNIEPTMTVLRKLLTAQAGVLLYKGRGSLIEVNQPGSKIRDVAWGPIPELLDFQPLGAGRSAKVVWQVKTRIPEVAANSLRLTPVLQFNEETSVGFGEDGFSTLTINGTLEIPLTRATQNARRVPTTADYYRDRFMSHITSNPDTFDLKRFRVTRREFQLSRDKRTLEWSFELTELPYMGMPPNMTVARGNYTVKPAKSGMGMVLWLCTLRGTYTVAKDQPRRLAWDYFLMMLQWRMRQSEHGWLPPNNNGAAGQNGGGGVGNALVQGGAALVTGVGTFLLSQISRAARANNAAEVANAGRRALLIDFNLDEGLYVDSKTITFSASWRLVTTISHILVASGVWKKSLDVKDRNLWATSVANISGANSWLTNRMKGDIIVDFGDSGGL